AITELPIPTVDSQPVGLTVGPSGTDIWFVEVHGNQVGQSVSPPAPGGHRPSGVHRSWDAADIDLPSPSRNVEPVGANAVTSATPAGDATDWRDYLGTPLHTQTPGHDHTPAYLAESVHFDALSEDVLISLVFDALSEDVLISLVV